MRTRTVSFNLPTVDFDIAQTLSSIKDKVTNWSYRLSLITTHLVNRLTYIFHTIIGRLKEVHLPGTKSPESGFQPNVTNNRYHKKIPAKTKAILLIILLVLLLLFVGGKIFGNKQQIVSNSQTRLDAPSVLKSQDINKEFTFPLKDANGKEVGDLKYMIEKAELQNSILIQGQKADAVKGKLFLVISLKITNEHNKNVDLRTRDYIRLSVNDNKDEWLAPDIHNDPVSVQAISTKYTHLAFAIDNSAKNLLLRVGEIDGDKEEIALGGLN